MCYNFLRGCRCRCTVVILNCYAKACRAVLVDCVLAHSSTQYVFLISMLVYGISSHKFLNI